MASMHISPSPLKFEYLSGFGNHHLSEAKGYDGALPTPGNTPQQCPYGLYAEQLSGTAFTAPRAQNQKVWFYRILPSVVHPPFELDKELSKPYRSSPTPNQLRWSPLPLPPENRSVKFYQGWSTYCTAGSPELKHGLAIHMYAFNLSMVHEAMQNSDGDLLIVPELSGLEIQTEHGWLEVKPNEFAVIPRGIKFKVQTRAKNARGYLLEVYDGHFELPELGPIGANGLANPRDFFYPVAAFEDDNVNYTLINKYMNTYWTTIQSHSPFDVVAWHGNYAPYKYPLDKFCPVNAVGFDHLDPSIFTVLTCKSTVPGVAVADFVIFPPRWAVAENTFRPPYFHRNTMSEFMGLVTGSYEAKKEGFQPGGASLHSMCTAHGPDAATYETHSVAELIPAKVARGSMAFMFESSYMFQITDWALKTDLLQKEYWKHWQDIKSHFERNA